MNNENQQQATSDVLMSLFRSHFSVRHDGLPLTWGATVMPDHSFRQDAKKNCMKVFFS